MFSSQIKQKCNCLAIVIRATYSRKVVFNRKKYILSVKHVDGSMLLGGVLLKKGLNEDDLEIAQEISQKLKTWLYLRLPKAQ